MCSAGEAPIRTQDNYKDGLGVTVENLRRNVWRGHAKLTVRPADGHEGEARRYFPGASHDDRPAAARARI